MVEKNIFGLRLKELREESEISQAKMAKVFHIGQQTISQWEMGTREPPFDMVVSLAAYFRTSADYLFGLTNVKSEPDYKRKDKLPGELKPRRINPNDFEGVSASSIGQR